MIRKLPKANRINKTFSVCDIENRSDGTVLAIDTYDGETHTVHSNWAEWLQWLRTSCRSNKRLRTIYAHNGGGWDWLSFLEWLIPNNPQLTFDTISNGGKIVAITLQISKRNKVKLCDSLYLLKCDLETAGRKYVGRGKIPTQHLPEWYYDNDREAFWAYLYNDCELLHKVMTAFADLFYSKVAQIPKLGLTLPSTTLRAFQTEYLRSDIGVPENAKLKQLLRLGYFGGRVEAFAPGYYPQIYVYDFNSLYPSVMFDTPVPTTGKVVVTKRFRPNEPGLYYVRFNQRNRTLKPLLLVKGYGEYRGTGWYYEPELRRLIQLASGEIEVIEGYVFTRSEVVFREFVDRLYTLRMTDRNGPLGEVCKLCMNSLYGKFAQKPVRSKTACYDNETLRKVIKSGGTVEVLSAAYGIYKVTSEKPLAFEHVGISGTITSEARARLWEAFNAGVVYCDTDSVHTTQPIPHDNNGLGKLKLEFSGEAVYLGKKLYALRNQQTEKVRAKGIRVGGKLGCKLDFDSLLPLLADDTMRLPCKFSSAATATKVLQGKKACVFSTQTRRIRKVTR